ncbi:MAG: PHB depolymerase family esterase [Phycisphaeraceae bacterium JB051]
MQRTYLPYPICLILLLLTAALPLQAQQQTTRTTLDAIHKKLDNGLRGTLMASFMDQSSDSSLASMIARIKFRTSIPPMVYNIEDETFVLYVPKAYDPTVHYGLVVYLSNLPAMVPPEDWQKVLDDNKLIWVSANNAGKDQSPYRRMGLALDGLFNATLRYRIDTNRINVAGMHSGAQLASVLAVHYPEQFSGGLFMHDCLYHRDIHAIRDDPTVVDEGYRRPMMDKLYRAKTGSRYVIMTGEKASDLPKLKAIVNRGFVEDRFKHVQLITIPESNTSRPDANWLAKAIKALEPLPKQSTQPTQ